MSQSGKMDRDAYAIVVLAAFVADDPKAVDAAVRSDGSSMKSADAARCCETFDQRAFLRSGGSPNSLTEAR